MTESDHENSGNEHIEDVESQSGDETGTGELPTDQNKQQPPQLQQPPQAHVAAGQIKRRKRTRTRGIPPTDLMTLLLAFNDDSTQEQIEKGCKDTIKDAIKWHFLEIKSDPTAFFKMGTKTPKMIDCKKCKFPILLHVDHKIECKIKERPDSDVATELEIQLLHTDSSFLIWDMLVEVSKPHDNQAERSLPVAQPPPQPEPKRVALPQFTIKSYSSWSANALAWDARYRNSHPLDKFFDLMNALQKSDEGKPLAEKLQIEMNCRSANDIVQRCLDKLAEYLDVNAITKANEVTQDWLKFKREADESLKDYIDRFEHLKLRRKEAKLEMGERSYAWELMHRARLTPQNLTLIQGKVNFDSHTVLKDMISALNIVVLSDTTPTYYQDRGRGRFRNENGFRRRSLSRRFCGCRPRCTCGDCKEHDIHMEEYGRPKSLSATRSGSFNRRGSSERRNWKSPQNRDRTGMKIYTNVYTFNAYYYSGFEKVALIDTGCQPILMSRRDMPHLEKMLGKKPETTTSVFPVKFGDGEEKTTSECILVPFWNGETSIMHEVGVCDTDIPLLLGLQYLRSGCEAVNLDGGLKFRSGETLKFTGDTERHLLLTWNKELHYGPQPQENKVDDNSSIILDDFYNLDSSVFYQEDDILSSPSIITTNWKDYLLDSESVDKLRHFKPIEREGYLDMNDTDRVYLFRNNLLDKLSIQDPFCYSDISNSILKNTHDRGFSGDIDLEEMDHKPKTGKKKVRFQNDVTVKDYNKYDISTKIANLTSYAIKIDKCQTSYYTQMTRKPVEINEPKPIFFTSTPKKTTFANKAAPASDRFDIRSSGQILDIETDKYSAGSNYLFSIFTVKATSPDFKEGECDYHKPEKSGSNEGEGQPDPEDDDSEGEPPEERIITYSQKQIHDARKRKAPKKKAIRGGKAKSKAIKANSEIPGIKSAMEKEYQKFIDYDVFEEVKDSHNIYKIPSQWVITSKDEKKEGEGSYKARLVCLGNLDKKFNLRATDSPTISRESLRMILSTIANLSWRLRSCDVSSAFLQGCELERTVYMSPPKEFKKEGVIWRLKKPVYGLADSGRLWYQKIRKKLLELGCKILTGDEACFLYTKKGKLQGLLGIHVDDIVYAGTDEFENNIIQPLTQFFNISKSDADSFVFCGMKISQASDRSITVSQREYAASIEDIPDYSDKSEAEKTTLLKSIAGQVLYLAWTRPDIVFDASDLLRVGRTSDERLKLAEKLLKKVKDGTGEIKFKKLGNLSDLELYVHSDASYNNLKNGKVSTAGYVILLKSRSTGNCCPISWSSKPIVRVTRSTMSAEARALEAAADHAVLYARQIKEIYTGKRTNLGIAISCHTDSKVLHDALVSTRQVEEKSLVHLIYGLKDKLDHREIYKIDWVNTKNQLADGLTKTGVDMTKLMYMIEDGNFPNSL